MSDLTPETNDAAFEADVLKSSVPVVVDLWAPWCGPCRTLGPILEDIATGLDGKAKIVKLNVDDNADTASKLSVMNIPTLVFFKNGVEVDRAVGVLPKEELLKKIQSAIEN
ncbi:MAG: thioredoxin 1 [Candidatus Omnitrophota bacterium]|jgi:thioredoxin 1